MMRKDPFAEEEMAATQAMKDAMQDEAAEYAQEIADDLGVSHDCALDILYFRGLSRWTEELEEELIDLHVQGQKPDMKTFGR